MTPVAPAAMFWDMDGTLTDSEPLWGQATYQLSEKLGKRLTPELRQQTVGATFSKTLGICARHAGVQLQPGDEEHYRQLMFSTVRGLFAEQLDVFPGVRPLLQQLHGDGIPMLVTTNTERYVADPAIDAIGRDFFVDTICGDEVSVGKPAPEMYLEAARRVDKAPEECLVFEDSYNGMRAARDAGCQVIGLPETESMPIPDGVVPIATLHSGSHIAGATADDVYAWFATLASR